MSQHNHSLLLPANQGRLNGRVAMITGAAGGIGAAAARLFANQGACVAICDIDVERGQSVQQNVTQAGGVATFFKTDIRSLENLQETVSSISSQFGKLDILFNCAGGSLPADDYVTEVDLSVWDTTMGLDLWGTIASCRAAIPELIRCGGGAVVNMSSGAALRGSNPAHIYTAAKGAVVSLTKAMAGAYAKNGIRVNAICSGRVNTERIQQTYGIPGAPGQAADKMSADDQVKMYPFWFGEPDDIANIALFLASNESRMITGASIPADGGRSAY